MSRKPNNNVKAALAFVIALLAGPVLAAVPVAVPDTYDVQEDQPLTVGAPGVLDNDSDPDGDLLTADLVSDVSNGTLTLNADGSFSYSPDGNFEGTDSFTYEARDGEGPSNTVTVTITVHPVNDAPAAADDNYLVDEDQTLSVASPGVLDNDTDADGDGLTAVLVSDVANGTLTLNPDGSFTYTPDGNFEGTDGFTYAAHDGDGPSNTATVTITVNPINDAPVAADDSYPVDEDQTLSVSAPGVLDNDTDVDGDELTAVLVSDVSNGTLTLNTDGSFTYTPDGNFEGTDSFTYEAQDGDGPSNTATVTITVNPLNDAPVGTDDNYSVDEDETLSVAAPGLLGNDTDVDGDGLTAVLVSDVSNGTLTLNADGSFTYVPDADFDEVDSFT
ncbi:MAG TPA: cadherin-like domain-containing protein, partial [Pseudomonadales bacterium]